MTIVDTSSWIEALRATGDPAVRARVENLLDQGEAAWCEMIRLELWRGVRGGQERRAIEFLERRVDTLAISDVVWEAAVRLMTKARISGLSVPPADVLIVATAKHHGVAVEHCDQHMDQLLKLV